jgi:tetratricopeptide (TPR) repeat protein
MPGRPGAKHAGVKAARHSQLPPRTRVGVIPPIAPGFAARTDMADSIAGMLDVGTSIVLVPASSFAEGRRNWLGATGKTQLAAYVAESLWQSAAVDVLVWISATDRAAILSGYVQASVAVTGLDAADGSESVAARFLSWLGETTQQWLVVLDDLPDPKELDDLWPAGPGGRVLVTTPRVPLVSVPGRQVLPIGLYSVREALDGVTERLNATPAQRQGAIDLIDTLGREPLALAQACAVMESSGMTCRDYRDYVVRRKQQLPVVPGQVPSAAAATWTLSLDHAERLLPGDAIRLLLVLVGLLDGHGIPGAVFGTAAIVGYVGGGSAADQALRRTWDALRVLDRSGLVTVDGRENPPAVRMSLAVQAAVLAAAPASWRDRAARAAADALLEVWPAGEPRPWAAAALRANASALWQSSGDVLMEDGCHPLLIRAGCSYDDARLTGPAVEHWRRLAAYVDQVPGHPDAAAVTARLAAAYLAAGEGTEAATWYRRVLAERTRVLVHGNPAIIEARLGLGRSLLKAGQAAEAVLVLTEAAGECERFIGSGQPVTLAASDDLAAAYLAAGKGAEAIRLLQRILGDRERAGGPRDPGAMSTRERLATALLAAGKPKDALAHTKKVLADRELALGKMHPDTIEACALHAAVNHATGRMPAALQFIDQACADSVALLGADHPDTLARRANMGLIYYAAGRVSDGITVLRDTLSRCERVLPADDPLTAAVRQSLLNVAGDDGLRGRLIRSPARWRRTASGARTGRPTSGPGRPAPPPRSTSSAPRPGPASTSPPSSRGTRRRRAAGCRAG